MRIEVIGRHVEVSDAIRQHAEMKAAKLPKYYDGVQQITITVSKQDHHKHSPFDAELVIDVEKHDDFVSHAQNDDLYAAIDEVIHKGVRQLSEFKDRLKQ
jgi:putative sigma-54 modulation protein